MSCTRTGHRNLVSQAPFPALDSPLMQALTETLIPRLITIHFHMNSGLERKIVH